MSTQRVHANGSGSSVIRTALVTVAGGGLTFLIANALGQSRAICVMLSILIGGIVLLVRFLVEFENRLASVEKLGLEGMNDMKQLVGQAFTEIGEATELFGLVEASALQTDVVTQLVRNSTRISPASPPIVYHFAQSRIREMSDFLKQLGEGGTLTYEGEDRDWLLGLTRAATVSVDAISLTTVDHDLWHSEIGQRYLDVQRHAARAGRRVRRIFVLDSPDVEHDHELRRTYQVQREMMIEVRLLDEAAVPPPLRVRVASLILFDDALVYETIPTFGDPRLAQVAQTRLVLTESRVKECAQLFKELWDVSRELDGQTKA